MGRDLEKGDPKACRNPRSSCLKIISSCFVVCLYEVAVAAIALGHFPSKLQENQIQNSMKAENLLFSPLAREGQTALSCDVYVAWHFVA